MNLSGYSGVAMIVLVLFFEVCPIAMINPWGCSCGGLVRYFLHDICHVHPRSRCIYQDGLNLADRRYFWRRCSACHHEPRHRPSRCTVFVLCGCRLLCVWSALAHLYRDCPSCESASGSCARTVCVTGRSNKSSPASSGHPGVWRGGEEEEPVLGTANGGTRSGSAEGMVWVTTKHCLCFVLRFTR